MRQAGKAFSANGHTDPLRMLEYAHRKTTAKGSATACVAALQVVNMTRPVCVFFFFFFYEHDDDVHLIMMMMNMNMC